LKLETSSNSSFLIPHSPFLIHHSPFTIHHSPFTIHTSIVQACHIHEHAKSGNDDPRKGLGYQDCNDDPGFTRVVPMEEIRAKDGNLSVPL